MSTPFKPYTLTSIATNSGRFADFAPYVPSISDAGVVAFQAALADGHSGVFTGDGQSIVDVAVTASAACPAREFASHPDINRAGTLAVYAALKAGGEAVLLVQPDGRITPVVDGADGFCGIGPLGPTMNEDGDVAFRATLPDGRASVGLWRGGRLHAVADAGERFASFEGLPVVGQGGQVVFRAGLPGGQQGVFVHGPGRCDAVVVTGDELEEIGRFPAMDDHGVVAFAARRRRGGWGVFSASAGRLACLVGAEAGFEGFRGVLVNNAGPVVFYATPVGGQLGVYAGADPARHRVLGLGDSLFGAAVADFALNPVSVNAQGQLAIRVALADGRQFILRGDPAG
jgi:hypothetical protein